MTTLQIGMLYGGATFIALFSGMPIAFAVGTVALLFMFMFMPAANIGLVAETIYSELDNFTLLTIPLFVLMCWHARSSPPCAAVRPPRVPRSARREFRKCGRAAIPRSSPPG